MPLFQTLLINRKRLTRVLPLMRHADVPLTLKAITAGLGLLIISPLDIFSDIPVLGVLDDAVLLTLLCLLFVAVANKYVQPSQARPLKRVNAA